MQAKAIQLIALGLLLVVGAVNANQQLWQKVSPQTPGVSSISLFQVDDAALRTQLTLAPHESTGNWSHQIQIPMPDGELLDFSVVESPIVAAELGAKFPGIKTYKIRGIDDSHASGRIGITPLGFHGMIHTSAGVIYLDPEDSASPVLVYRTRFKGNEPTKEFSCGLHDTQHPVSLSANTSTRIANRIPGNLIRYDLAVAATFEYFEVYGNSIANTLAAITMTIMRVNVIYERDLGITLRLVADNDAIIETVDNGQLENEDANVLIEQVESWIDNRLPGRDSAYDIGHMFFAPKTIFGGGAAYLGVVCNDDLKANGVTGLSDPRVGDPFDIDFVAHEIGHQFGAEHSFNGTTNSCISGRIPAAAFEPGSGSSIMAYAGLCGQENLQMNSDATFHAGSIAQIDRLTRRGGNCYVATATNPADNVDPVIAEITNKVIPSNTPFILEGNATDDDNVPLPIQTLSYQWDQMDAGCPTNSTSFGTDTSDNALFRSYVPRNENWRNFPALGTQVQGRFDKAEVLPCHNRDLNFRLTARDGNSGQDYEDVRVSVVDSAGPFAITNLNTMPFELIFAGTEFAVNWNVASTNLSPVNCAKVDFDLISFSADYSRYSIHPLIAVSSLNDGSEMVTLNPATATHLRSRVRVKCSDNIFYDLSDVELRVVNTMNPPIDLDDIKSAAYTFATPAIAMATVAPACGIPVKCESAPEDGGEIGGRSGSGAVDYLWLIMLSGIIALVKCRRRYSLQ